MKTEPEDNPIAEGLDSIAEAIARGLTMKFDITHLLSEALFANPDGPHRQKNLVDALFAIAENLHGIGTHLKYLGTGEAGTTMGAIEYLAKETRDGDEAVAERVACRSRGDQRAHSGDERLKN
jgi:hypothetical protein